MIDLNKFQISQEKEEKVLKIIKKHKIFLFLYVLYATILLFFIPIFLILYEEFFFTESSFLYLINPDLPIILFGIYILTISFMIFNFWIDFALDVRIITNFRIISTEQKSLFSRKMSQVYLDNIEDVSGTQDGFFAHIFNFGDILIQTAAEKNMFKWHNIPKPFWTTEYILDLHRDFYKNHNDSINNLKK